MNLSGEMMEILRQRRGLNEDDTRQDKEILKMRPTAIVRECATWKLGDAAWADIFAGWMKYAGARPGDFHQ